MDAVNEWLQSKHVFHVMRDHPGHDLSILAGMWGVKTLDDEFRPIVRRIFLAMLKHPQAYWNGKFENTQTGMKNLVVTKSSECYFSDHTFVKEGF